MLKSKHPYLAWLTCALFFMFQYVLRISPSVMMQPLREDFQVNADQFATLGSLYLYAYALVQIPLGFCIDRFGMRRMTLISLMFCAVGMYVSAKASEFWHLQAARAMVGAGSGIAFIGALKIASDYFETKKRGILMGLTLSLGTVGALSGGRPLVVLIDNSGWRDSLLLLSFMMIPLILLAVFTLPSRQKGKHSKSGILSDVSVTLKAILGNRYLLIYMILAVGLYTPLSSLADLWGTEFIKQKYKFSTIDAATANTMMYLGMAIGSLVLGWIFKSGNQLKRGIQISGLFLFFVMSFIVLGPPISFALTMLMFCLMGFFCGAEMLCFSATSEHTTAETSGLTLGFVNTVNMLGGAVLQQLIGSGLDWQWSGAYTESGLRLYSTETYQTVLTSLLIITSFCVFLSFRLNAKKRKP